MCVASVAASAPLASGASSFLINFRPVLVKKFHNCILPFERGEANHLAPTLDGYLLDVVPPQGIGERRDISGSDTFGRHDIRNAIWRRRFCSRKIRLFDPRCH